MDDSENFSCFRNTYDNICSDCQLTYKYFSYILSNYLSFQKNKIINKQIPKKTIEYHTDKYDDNILNGDIYVILAYLNEGNEMSENEIYEFCHSYHMKSNEYLAKLQAMFDDNVIENFLCKLQDIRQSQCHHKTEKLL